MLEELLEQLLSFWFVLLVRSAVEYVALDVSVIGRPNVKFLNMLFLLKSLFELKKATPPLFISPINFLKQESLQRKNLRI